MRKFYASAAFFLLCISLSAQTTVSGFINANTNWNMAGSPYIVTGNALLSQGYTLTIDPGVVVKFGTNNALQIDGELIAIGTPTQHITFTSNQSNPQPGDWAKLHFSDFSVDAVYNAQGNYVSGSILKYCDVLYGGSLLWGSIDIQQSSPYINHCRVMLGSWCGINFNGDSITIDSSRISDLPKRGIYYDGGNFLMRNDTFQACQEGAIHFAGNFSTHSRILGSFFRWNYTALSGSLHHVTLSNNLFLNNNGPSCVSLTGGWDTLNCNRFRYNCCGPVVEMQSYSNNGPVVIHNNIIEYNGNTSINSWNGTSVFYMGIGGSDTVYIDNNIISHNSSPGNPVCVFLPTLTGAQNTFQFYNNQCTENEGESFMYLLGPQTNNPSFDFMVLDSNTFVNPLCTYELKNGIPYGSPNLFVANNYWGTSSTSVVDNRIYDYFDYANESVVYYMPILNSQAALDTSCKPFQVHAGIRENQSARNDLQIYPNPTNSSISISVSEQSQYDDAIIEILNPLSQIIYHADFTGSTTTTIALPEESGVYIIRLITKDGTSVARVVRE